MNEIEAMTGLGALAGLEASLAVAHCAWTALVHGEPIAMFGAVSPSLLSERAQPWLLGTDEIARHPRALMTYSRAFVAELLETWPVLANHVDARHTAAICYLRRLGFRIDAAVPFGPKHQPFHPFSMERR